MPDLALLTLDEPTLHALRDAPHDLAHARSVRFGESRALVLDVARQMTDMARTRRVAMPWGGYLAMDRATRTIVGTCAFTGAPGDDATVEIAYLTFPAHEGRGHATAMADALLAISADAPDVRHVVAHTLPQPGASGRILAKLGFRRDGEAQDPDAGTVWRWRRDPPAR